MVRVGVIGTGAISNNLHIPSLKAEPKADVVAICGRNQKKANELASKFSISSVYADYREMFDRERLDAVVVLYPTYLHHPIVMMAIEAGCHFLCEKPLSLNPVEAEDMLNAAESRGLKHMTFYQYREAPQFAYARQLVNDGYVGKPIHYTSQYTMGTHFQHVEASDWRANAQMENGALGDLGSHVIDMMTWYFGPISRVFAVLRNVLATHLIEEGVQPANELAVLHSEHVSGVTGVIHASFISGPGYGHKARIEGSEGVIEVEHSYFGKSEVRGAKVGKGPIDHITVPSEFCVGRAEPNELDAWMHYLTDATVGTRSFIQAILNDTKPTPSFEDGLAVQRVIEAAKKASSKQAVVQVS